MSNLFYFSTGGQHNRDIAYLMGARDIISGGPIDAPEFIPGGYANDSATNGLGKRLVNYPIVSRDGKTSL